MKIIVIYYSYSGNTQEVSLILSEYLKEKGEVGIVELKGLDESNKFFSQVIRALQHKKAKVQPVSFDLSGYDLICLGTPVWAFGPAPAVNTYLEQCSGVGGKEVVLYATYGSGTGKERCLNYMQKILAEKGAKAFKRFFIQQGKVTDREFVLSKIKEILPLSFDCGSGQGH
ncbi:MAG: NAD(P)H-dependent oxidoreductase [Candidatus Omnitrophica bacterium]|nr:NAD(P)H-dependent oxidoreductase [Candidatus Omnitrophota bacterium]